MLRAPLFMFRLQRKRVFCRLMGRKLSLIGIYLPPTTNLYKNHHRASTSVFQQA